MRPIASGASGARVARVVWSMYTVWHARSPRKESYLTKTFNRRLTVRVDIYTYTVIKQLRRPLTVTLYIYSPTVINRHVCELYHLTALSSSDH